MRDGRIVRKVLAVVWAVIPPLVLSALIHATDPDVGGVGGVLKPSTVLSVVVYGLPVVALCLLCLALAIRSRWVLWVPAMGLLSAIVALVIALLQRPHPAGLEGFVRPFVGGAVLVWLFFAVAVVPARALGWATSRGQSPAAP